MVAKEAEKETHRHSQRLLTILQSGFICILIVLVILMMTQINRLQGTARVINYAGLVRGATQRLVKLEIIGNSNDELIGYLDEVLLDLKNGNGTYKLVRLDSNTYQEKLEHLIFYWNDMKEQIDLVRESDCSPSSVTKLVEMSEVYFQLADETVSASEEYSDKIARQIRIIELASAVDMFLLFCMIVEQTISAMRMYKKNIILARKAYIDTQTGLQSKNMCEELLNTKEHINESTVCLMFDINNLKDTNDKFGHSIGDQLIIDFATAIKKVIREEDFAGRSGGDEFIILLYGGDENTAREVLKRLHNEVEHFNSLGKNIPISYAEGFAVSEDYKNCTFRKLFDEADRNMYKNKQKMKTPLKKTHEK